MLVIGHRPAVNEDIFNFLFARAAASISLRFSEVPVILLDDTHNLERASDTPRLRSSAARTRRSLRRAGRCQTRSDPAFHRFHLATARPPPGCHDGTDRPGKAERARFQCTLGEAASKSAFWESKFLFDSRGDAVANKKLIMSSHTARVGCITLSIPGRGSRFQSGSLSAPGWPGPASGRREAGGSHLPG